MTTFNELLSIFSNVENAKAVSTFLDDIIGCMQLPHGINMPFVRLPILGSWQVIAFN